jgi:putative aldouronate transport system substrate-binding protein
MLRNGGLITDLADIFYDLNDELQQMYLEEYYSTLQTCMVEGSLYALPSPSNPYEFAKKIYIRKDWLALCGKEVPATYEQLIDVAKAFKTNAAAIAAVTSNVSESQIVPIGIHKDLAYVDNYGPTGLFELFGAQVGAYLPEGDTLTAANTSANMKAGLAAVTQMYADGLIAREFYTKSSANIATDVIAGKVGIIFGDWWIPEYPLGMSVINAGTPTADWVGIDLVGPNGGTALPIVKPISVSTYNMVSKTTAHPEAVARLLNLFYDVYYNDDALRLYGDKSTAAGGFFHNWIPIKVWNSSASIQEHKRVMSVFDDLFEAGYRVPNLSVALTDANVAAVEQHAEYGEIFNRLKAREKALHFIKGYPYFQSQQFGVEVKNMTAVAKAGFGIFEEMIAYNGGYAYVAALSSGEKTAKYNMFYGTATKTMQSKGEYLNTMLVTYFSKVIVGEESISKWDGFVNDYNKNGGTKILQEVAAWYAGQPKLS